MKQMDTVYPYRVAWHKPEPVNVRSSSRAAVLNALEYEFPTSKARLAARTGLGNTTVLRACRQLIRERVMTLKYGRDPDSGISCDLVTMARYPVLPILEITDAYMVWRLCDTRGDSVFATVRDRGGFCSPEDDLATLMGQVATIIRAGTCGLPAEVPLQPPVLLLPTQDTALVGLVRRGLDSEPACILTPEDAAAHELRYHPATQDVSSVLYIRAGETCTASLLERVCPDDMESPFRPAPYAAGLGQALRESTRGLPSHTTARWQRTAAFLTDFLRFITPSCVVVETDRPIKDPKPLRNALPSDVRLQLLQYALNTPSLAHRGALRLTRRALWDSMESDPQKSEST